MKRLIVFILLFVVVNSVYSQQRDEWYWDESTKDAVYETPNSKFVKKWYRTPYNEPEECLELLANGTFKYRMTTFRETLLDGNRLYINTTFSGTWNRKDKMILELHFKNVTNVGDPDLLAKLSARKKEEVNKKVKNIDAQIKARVIGTIERFSIQRIDKDHLIMDGKQFKSDRLRVTSQQHQGVEGSGKIYELADVDVIPKYPEGYASLANRLFEKIEMPSEDVQGAIEISFVVEKDGNFSKIEVSKSLEPSLDEQVLQAVKSLPRFLPGEKNGNTVRVKTTAVFKFSNGQARFTYK